MLLAVIVATVVVAAGYAGYAYWVTAAPPGETTLIVYTYPSLFGGSCSAPAFDTVFGAFAAAHGVHFDIECPMGTLSSTLIGQAASPRADLVIGLDEVTAPQADEQGVLVPYASPQLAHVPTSLVSELSPDHAVTPYESGFLAIDYSLGLEAATGGRVATSSFDDFASNSSWASALTIEDPTVDITGEEFLLWQIAYAEAVAHENWTEFWKAVDPNVHVAPDWGTAFSEFNTTGSAESAVVSYATDPAYAAYTGTSGAFNATLSTASGHRYGWQAVYGLGIVRGSAHIALDEAFIDWFLSGTVQSLIPTNEWEYPANETTPLPPSFSAAVDPAGVIPLNPTIPGPTVVAELGDWLNEWQKLENAYG